MDKTHVVKADILSNNWYTLKKVTYEVMKDDGSVVTHTREAYDRGNGATILLYNTGGGRGINLYTRICLQLTRELKKCYRMDGLYYSFYRKTGCHDHCCFFGPKSP